METRTESEGFPRIVGFTERMLKPRVLLSAGVVVAAVTAGAVGGALLFTPSSSGAQDGITTSASEGGGMPGPGFGFKGGSLEVAATALGMDESALRDELRGGKTIADVAKEKKVDVQTVIDALVEAADTKIDQAVSDGRIPSDRADDMKARTKDMITAFVNGQMPGRLDGDWRNPPPPTDA